MNDNLAGVGVAEAECLMPQAETYMLKGSVQKFMNPTTFILRESMFRIVDLLFIYLDQCDMYSMDIQEDKTKTANALLLRRAS
jgi:hypothetical protein